MRDGKWGISISTGDVVSNAIGAASTGCFSALNSLTTGASSISGSGCVICGLRFIQITAAANSRSAAAPPTANHRSGKLSAPDLMPCDASLAIALGLAAFSPVFSATPPLPSILPAIKIG